MSKSKRFVGLVASIVLVLSLALVGCGTGGTTETDSSGSANSGEAVSEIRTIKPGVITVGSDCDYPPFIWMEGTAVLGFEKDLLEAIAQAMDYELEFAPPQSFNSIPASVAAGVKMDVGCSSITIRDDRSEIVDFTTPYFDSNQAAVALVDSSYTNAMDFDGKVVGAQAGTTGADWVKENLRSEGTTLKVYDQASEMMAALIGGEIEGAFYDEPAALEWANTLYTNTHIVETIPTGEQYGIAVAKDNPALLEAMNEAMIKIKKDGTFDEIFLRYFPEFTPPSLGVKS